MKPLNIIIADDHAIFGAGLTDLLKRNPNVQQVVYAENGREALEYLAKDNYDFLFLDMGMPVMDGEETLRHIKQKGYQVNVVVITMFANLSTFLKVWHLGISGYILKDTNYKETARAIDLIMDGGQYCSPSVMKMIEGPTAMRSLADTFSETASDLTEKEREVLLLICDQLSGSEIADTLSLSLASVKRYKQILMEKTGTTSQVGLAMYAVKHGVKEL